MRDSRFLPHGLAYRFLDDEKTHWLAGEHAVKAWVASVDWANTVVVAHHVRFDGSILAWRYNVKPFAWMDTVGLAKAVLGENISGYSLKRLAEYLGLPAKGEISCEGIIHPTPEQMAILGDYCKNDVEICKAIYEKLMPQFPASQLGAMNWTIRCFVEPALVLDLQVLQKGVENEKKRREEIIQASGISRETLSSNKQFAEYLGSKGITVPTKISSRTGKAIPAFAKTDEGLARLQSTHPKIYEARLASKANLLETRGEALLSVGKTGSFPFDVGFSGAVQTHRGSGGSGAGGNPQNFTRNSFLRTSVRSPSGLKLVVGDFAAIELRILAWLAKEPKLMASILADADTYCEFASLFYGRVIKKGIDLAERHFGKCSVLGLGYNMGGKKFKITADNELKKFVEQCRLKGLDVSKMPVSITEDQAWRTVELYRTTYFNVPKLWQQMHDLLPLIAKGQIGCLWFAPFIKVQQNALVLPSGLRIQYPNLRYGWYFDKKSNKKREGWHYDAFYRVYESDPVGIYGGMMIENICQALAGELIKEAIDRAEASGLQCVGQIHDEVLALHKDGAVGSGLLKKAMEVSPKWMPTLKLKSEVAFGDDWNAAKG